MKLLAGRRALLQYLEPAGKSFVEIGVHLGQFSQAIRRHNPGRLILIDPWFYCDENRALVMNTSQEDYDRRYHSVCKMFETCDNVEIIRATSEDASEKMEDDSLDIVYVDGNHLYRFVLLDLFTWWPKVKSGGWLAGHDLKGGEFRGVRRAYNLFLQYVDPAEVVQTTDAFPSYAIRKR